MKIWRYQMVPFACAAALVVSGCGTADNGGDAAPDTDAGDTATESTEQDAGDPGEDAAEADGDTDVDEALEEAGIDADSGAADSSHPFPELPDEFPLPDEHMILRTFAMDAEPMGYSLEVSMAADGTPEGQANFYANALSDVYGNIETTGPDDSFDGSYSVTFSGPDFNYGGVVVGENEGHLDSDDIDSSHLPVYISVVLEENARD